MTSKVLEILGVLFGFAVRVHASNESRVNALPGETVRFTCDFNRTDVQQVVWFHKRNAKQGSVIFQNEKISREFEGKVMTEKIMDNIYSLTVQSLLPSDNGIYICKGGNGADRIRRFDLTVSDIHVLPKSEEKLVRVILNTSQSFVGGSAGFVCHNQSEVSWYFQPSQKDKKKPVDFDSSPKKLLTTLPSSNKSVLHLHNVELKDAGIYTCAENVIFGNNHVFLLIVTPFAAVRIGESITLPCYTSSPSRTWSVVRTNSIVTPEYSESNITSDAGFEIKQHGNNFALTIRQVHAEHSGTYNCHSKESQPFKLSIKLIVQIPFTAGERVILPCRPKVNLAVEWSFRKSMMDQETTIYASERALREHFEISAADGSYNLTIDNAVDELAGFYICIEKFGLGDRHFLQLIQAERASISTTTSTEFQNFNCCSESRAHEMLTVLVFMIVQCSLF